MLWLKNKKNKENLSLKGTSRQNEAGQTDGVLDDLKSYVPCGNLTPVDYRISPILEELETGFDSIVEKFLNETDPDKFNGSYMDAQIISALEDTLKDLRDQKATHRHTIEAEIEGIWSATENATATRLQNCLEELNEVETELEQTVRIMQRGTIYEEA